MLPLVFLLIADNGPAQIAAAPVETHDLGRMTFRQAQRLDGQAVRVAFDVRWSVGIDDEVHVGGHNLHGASVLIRFPRAHWPTGITPRQRMTVEGLLRTKTVSDYKVAGVREIEVVGAGLVRP